MDFLNYFSKFKYKKLFIKQVKDARFINKDITQDQAISDLEKFQREFQKLDMLGVRYQDFQRVLGLEVAQFEELRNLKEELEI